MREISSEVLVAEEPLVLVTRNDVNRLVARALANPRRRARILLHESLDNPLHEMLIVMTRGQYVPPLTNAGSPKSYLLIDGRFTLVEFDDARNITRHTILCAEPREFRFSGV